jgi:AraC family transcriptional regulator, regulatory protein of adaptative response / methylated-DNA-[protein]-cysteine methyltransferase
MIQRALPSDDVMYDAVVARDRSYDGIFFTAVRTTGIFCRPGCPARTPGRANVEFHASAKAALFAGYRPCKRCRPLEATGAAPEWLRPLLSELDSDAARRWTDQDLRGLGLDPTRVRRWFKQNHDMTFHAYHRARRVGGALRTLQSGGSVSGAAYEHGYESLSAFYDAFKDLLGDSPARSRRSGAEPIHFSRILTPLAPMLAAATERGLCLLEFTDRRMLETQLARVGKAHGSAVVPGENAVLQQTRLELDEYFAGARTTFDVPLHLIGSDFQTSAWNALLGIPFGETRSYAEQAKAIGRPNAVRAVGRANGDNRIAVIVPCHRVVGANGALTGYGGGLWRKRWLLEHEGANQLRAP